MIQNQNHPPEASHAQISVLVNGELFRLEDATPTGAQILAAASLRPAADYALVHWPSQGPTSEVGLDEVVNAKTGGPPLEFFATKADGVSYFTVDEERYVWAGLLDEEIVRRIARVNPNEAIWIERKKKEDHPLSAGEVVDIDREGVERLYTRKRSWTLDVQGEKTEWEQPQVVVRDALIKAGIDPTKPWIIILKVQDEAKREVGLDDIVDLTQPGIERLRLRPKDVTNGDGSQDPRRDFSVLAKDEAFLDASGFHWHTQVDGQRWLIVENYPLPAGYNVAVCRVAVDVPPDYPSAKLDMFYCDPPLSVNGVAPGQTEARQSIGGVMFQRWSRHRPEGSWSPATDNLATHFATIEESIGREVGA